jgi:hypothetical protein
LVRLPVDRISCDRVWDDLVALEAGRLLLRLDVLLERAPADAACLAGVFEGVGEVRLCGLLLLGGLDADVDGASDQGAGEEAGAGQRRHSGADDTGAAAGASSESGRVTFRRPR